MNRVEMPKIKMPDMAAMTREIERAIYEKDKPHTAEGYYERLVKMINEFDASLDSEHEVGVRLVNFGQTIQFHVVDLGFYNPGLIIFHGELDNGDKIQLTQHITQISFLLIAAKRTNPEKPKRRIGFNE